MTITKNQDGAALVIALEGRLDTNTAPELEKELKDAQPGVTGLTLDLEKLKTMSRQGEMKLVNVNEIIMEIFEITGFSDILTIE